MKEETKILNNIITITKQLCLEDDIMLEVLGGKPSTVLKNGLSYEKIANFSNYVGINIDQLENSSFDIESLKNNFYPVNISNIPDEYLNNTGTYMSTIRSLVNYIEKLYSYKVRKRALNKLELSESALRRDLKLNVSCLEKAGDFLKEINTSKAQIEQLAFFVNFDSTRKSFSQIFKNCKTFGEIAEVACKNSNKYDTNFNYSYQKLNGIFFIKAEIKEESNDSIAFSEASSYFRACTVAMAPLYFSNKKMTILDVKTKIENGKRVEYWIYEDDFMPQFSTQS